MSGLLQVCVRTGTQTEAKFTSVEQIMEYITVRNNGITVVIIQSSDRQLAKEQETEDFFILQNSNSSLLFLLFQTCVPEATNVANVHPPPDWPDQGRITFQEYQMRYRENSPVVLQNLNINIQSKEKIGIVGRTGSGMKVCFQFPPMIS